MSTLEECKLLRRKSSRSEQSGSFGKKRQHTIERFELPRHHLPVLFGHLLKFSLGMVFC
jgi:hypothetical protein